MKLSLSLSLLFSVALIGCKQDILTEIDPPDEQTNQTVEDPSIHTATGPMQSIRLGEKLTNPYSTANMEAALELLRDSLHYSNNTGVSLEAANAIEIYTTDLYVRMCATNEVNNKLLRNDSSLSLFAAPRDYSVAVPGSYYVDTIGVVDTRFQWWYCTVKPGYQPIEGVCYEVLDELFIPKQSRYYDPNGGGIMSRNLEQSLLIASFNLTNNQGELRGAKQGSDADTRLNGSDQHSFMGMPLSAPATRAYYTPRGRVTVEVMDGGVVKQIPVGNVRVRIARWFEEDSFYTTNDGYYASNYSWDEFWGGFDYSVFLTGEMHGCRYTMVDVFELVYVMPYQRIEGLTIVFDRSSKFCGPAMIHAATTDYFVKCVGQSGIHPIHQSLDIQVNSTKGATSGAAFLGFAEELTVNYNIDRDYYKDNIVTTWHELAHASFLHNMWVNCGYDFAYNFWNTVYFAESRHIFESFAGEVDPYGDKGDIDWQNIAIAEGWAYFLSDFMLVRNYGKHSSYCTHDFTTAEFPYNYQIMFSELENKAKITVTDLQRALTVNTLDEFKNKLKSFYVGDADIIRPYYDTGQQIIGGGGGSMIDRPIISGGGSGDWKPVVVRRSEIIEEIMGKYL